MCEVTSPRPCGLATPMGQPGKRQLRKQLGGNALQIHIPHKALSLCSLHTPMTPGGRGSPREGREAGRSAGSTGAHVESSPLLR